MKACNSCGKCCLKYGGGRLSASQDEILWWQQARPSIAQYVKDDQIWVDPKSGALLDRCPWLEHDVRAQSYSCAIYHDRPEECRQYPTEITEMVQDDCEMIESSDLLNPGKALQELRFLNG